MRTQSARSSWTLTWCTDMQDFAHLFGDSVAAWLRGRGDARFQQYERYHRADRSTKTGGVDFDLEASNERYARSCRRPNSRLVDALESKAFKSLIVFFVIAWGGSLLLPTVGKSQPVATAVVLCALFALLRVKAWRAKFRRK